MAQSRGTKRSSSSARSGGGSSRSGSASGGKSGGRQSSRRAQRRAQRANLPASVALFGAGLLLFIMVLVRGQNGWQTVRSWLFGAGGITVYFIWAVLIYAGYLLASGCRVGKFCAKMGLLAMLAASVPVVFSDFTLHGDESLWEMIKMLFARGCDRFWSGGVAGGILGVPLLLSCGRPVANILMILIFLLGLMVFFAVTPLDVAQFLHGQWQAVQARREARLAEENAYDTPLFDAEPVEESLDELTGALPAPPPGRGAHHRAFSANPYLDTGAPAAPDVTPAAAPAAAGPRPDFDVDLGPHIEDTALENAVAHDPLEPVVIGPGGTFGMDPLGKPGEKAPHRPAAVVPDENDEFAQRLPAQGESPAADEAAGDELDELIRRAMGPADAGSALPRPEPPADADAEVFDTLLEPPAGEVTLPLPDTGVLTPTPTPTARPGGVPTLGGSYDEMRDAWNAGTPLADAMLAGSRYIAPEAVADALSESSPATQPEHATAAAARYRARKGGKAAGKAVPDTAAAGVGLPEDEDDGPFPEPKPYAYPSLDLFNATRPEDEAGAEREMRRNADVLINTLDSFGVKTKILDICRGPSVTRYELQPQAGIKVSRITSLADDIALNLATAGVRIEAPIPGKPAVGIEVPNKIRSTVNIKNVFESQAYINMRSPLTMALGKDIAGTAQVADLCRMPHLLIAGSTGSGKSVCVNSIIISFLFRSSPEDVRLLLIDPKVVELAEYNGIPHLLMPVVTEPRKAAGALGASVAEMERRYQLFAEHNVREIKAFNRLAEKDKTLEHLPYIAIVIDELADLMMVAGKEVEDYICRIAQKARAAGIHLIVATQRPSVDVITGLIKANIPSRIAFAVSSQVDSRTILDAAGAEKLLGNGDMLFLPVGAPKPLRVQGTFVTDEEIAAVLGFIKSTSDARYDEEMIAEMERRAVAEKGAKKDADGDEGGALDPMFEQAVECVIEAGQASTSLLQRRCKLGYARAARIMDQMEQEKVIGPYEGAKPRSVLITMAQWQERKLSARSDG